MKRDLPRGAEEVARRRRMNPRVGFERVPEWGAASRGRRPPAEELTGLGAASSRVLLTKLVHATCGVDHFLLTGVERMAVRANLNLQILSKSRAGLERVAARAGHGDLFIVGMGGGFHGGSSLQKVVGTLRLMAATASGLKGARV
jgi:hypothetical protein